jgi:hypothetical protein
MWQTIVQHIQSVSGGSLSTVADWIISAALIVGAAVAAWTFHAAGLGLARHVLGERRPFLRTILGATKGPTRLGLLLIAVGAVLPANHSPTPPRI